MQIYKLAKELGMKVPEMIGKLKDLGMDTTNMKSLSGINAGDAEAVREALSIPPASSNGEDLSADTSSGAVTITLPASPPDPAPAKLKPPTTPWKPARRAEIPERFKDPRFTYRLCDKGTSGNIARKEEEGWVKDHDLSKKMNIIQRAVEDGTNIDTTYQIRELIAMKMPKEMAAARNKYYRDKATGAAEASTKHYREQVPGATGDVKSN